ncbi:UNVERIFIED_CONTAM: hypothetical protein Sindi_1133800 [Sesamum indicum]
MLAVHEILGLKGMKFQSLYHFTVGGPDPVSMLNLKSSDKPLACFQQQLLYSDNQEKIVLK